MNIYSVISQMEREGAYIYGCGTRTQDTISLLEKNNINILGIFDRVVGKRCGDYISVPIDEGMIPEKSICINTVIRQDKHLIQMLKKHFSIILDSGFIEMIDSQISLDCQYGYLYSVIMNGYGLKKESSLGNYINSDYLKREREIWSNYSVVRPHIIDSPRIGEFLCRVIWAAMEQNNNNEKGILDVCILKNFKDTNRAVINIFSKHIEIINEKNMSFWLYYFKRNINKNVDLSEWDRYEDRYRIGCNVLKDSCKTAKFFEFSDGDIKYGEKYLTDHNIKRPFICFTNRDSKYLEDVFPNVDYKYHDYRDSSIKEYELMTKEMENRGIFCVRTGFLRSERANFDNCFDYANDKHDDFMDVYLPGQAMFSIMDGGGINLFTIMQNKTIAIVNYIPLCDFNANIPQSRTWFYIPKRYYIKEEDRYLTLEECIMADLQSEYRGEKYYNKGITFINNSPSEIAELAIEVYERETGTWHENEDDEKLQSEYQLKYKRIIIDCCKKQGKIIDEEWILRGRIGTCFLRENQSWLMST